MKASLTVALKDLLLVWRDRAAVFWIAVFPLVFAVFLSAVLEGWSAREDLSLRAAVVDDDRSEAARAYIARFSRRKMLSIVQLSLDESRRRLQVGELDAIVHVLPGFGQRGDWYAGELEVLRVESDPSRRREAGFVRAALLEEGVQGAVETGLVPDPRASVSVVTSPVIAHTPTAVELVAPAAVLWGVLGCAAAFAVSLAAERRRGTLRRLRSLPVGAFEFLFGKSLACFALCIASAFVLLTLAVVVCGVRLAHPLGLLLSVVSLAFCFTGIMALLSTLGTSEQAVAGTGWATLLVLSMLGGAMAPRIAMPAWLESAGAFSPVRWGLVALEHALWRAGPVSRIVEPSGWLVLTGALGVLLGSWVTRRSAP